MIVVVVGTGAECDLKLPDPYLSVRHCEIFGVRGNVRVRDLGSTNGTRVRKSPTAVWLSADLAELEFPIGGAVLAGRTMIEVLYDGRVICTSGLTDSQMRTLLMPDAASS